MSESKLFEYTYYLISGQIKGSIFTVRLYPGEYFNEKTQTIKQKPNLID